MAAAVALRAAAQILAGRDSDWAEEANGVGYSKSDGPFGHALAQTPPEAWSPEVTRAAWSMLRRYRTQLAGCGVDFDAIPEPEATRESRDVRVIDHDGTRYVLRFGYDPDLIAEVKRLPGRAWDAHRKVWAAPLSDALRSLIDSHRFCPTAAARHALQSAAESASSSEPATGSVDQDGPRLLLRTHYDPALVAAIKEIRGRRWDPTSRVWVAPITSVVAVRELADRFALAWNVTDEPDDVDPVIRPVVAAAGGVFVVTFDYDRDLVAAIRDLPGASWNRARWAWTLPLSAAVDLYEFATQSGALVDPSADPHMGAAREATARVAESAATDADLEIPGLGGALMPFQRAGVAYALRSLGFSATNSGRWVRNCDTRHTAIT
jgi:hypothetical protein